MRHPQAGFSSLRARNKSAARSALPEKTDDSDNQLKKAKHRLWIFIVLFLVLVVGVAGAVWYKAEQPKQKEINFGFRPLSKVEIANTDTARAQGLGYRNDLAQDTGMLFVFEKPSVHRCFWMKDMKFAIDILWLDAAKKVVDIEKNVSPDSYPQSFCPETPAQYVLEVNAGLSDAAGVDVGSQL